MDAYSQLRDFIRDEAEEINKQAEVNLVL